MANNQRDGDDASNSNLVALIGLVGIFMFAGLMKLNNLRLEPSFQEKRRGYMYTPSRDVSDNNYLIDTNKDGIADLYVDLNSVGRSPIRLDSTHQRKPTEKEQTDFRVAYTNYLNRSSIK